MRRTFPSRKKKNPGQSQTSAEGSAWRKLKGCCVGIQTRQRVVNGAFRPCVLGSPRGPVVLGFQALRSLELPVSALERLDGLVFPLFSSRLYGVLPFCVILAALAHRPPAPSFSVKWGPGSIQRLTIDVWSGRPRLPAATILTPQTSQTFVDSSFLRREYLYGCGFWHPPALLAALLLPVCFLPASWMAPSYTGQARPPTPSVLLATAYSEHGSAYMCLSEAKELLTDTLEDSKKKLHPGRALQHSDSYTS